ncbi:hypothetical protein, variant [Saprolegnia diclina VS20]|uniref:PIPK domain-containing protein n=1 Tax=Saprolegnia diclina (strain VS20) TaxID=1156394 RepID=T0R6C5_SAPDV|nr:hypothetical protein, variant [Saprolegnia diclina VS20]EQC41990.1 hypothetical protein, variant [Saprolegnia diclina VS20]|eukprot:XP_008604558.1 hypothetical protein, variant [Saprolegnia diclina VS20]
MTAALAWQALMLGTGTGILVATIYVFIHDAKKRAHPGPVLICIVIASCAAMIARAAMELVLLSDAPSTTTVLDVANLADAATSRALGPFWCYIYFDAATIFWYLMLAMDLISSLSNPFLPFASNNLIHHAHAWPAAGIWTVIFRFGFFQRDFHDGVMRVWIVLPSYAVLLYIGIALRVAWAKSRVLQYEAHVSTRNMAMLILPYLAVFAAMSVGFLILYVFEMYYSTTSATNYLDQLLLGLSTLLVFVLYYFDSAIVFRLWGSTKASVARRRLSTMTNHTVTPNSPHYQIGRDTADDFAVDVAQQMRNSVMECTKAGIYEAASGMCDRDTVPGQIPLELEFAKVETKGILVHGQLATASDRLRFTDVAPLVFQSIRELFGIDAASYRDAFARSEGLRECGLKGKSGNIMYFTHNAQFMVKSVPRSEFDVLRSILPAYYKYLVTHRATHLCRYFGCHSITLPVGTRCMYFVVMQNLFNEGPVHEVYDIKGNTDRRQAIPDGDVERVMQDTLARRCIEPLMLDIDFSRIHRCMHLSDANATAMQGQLKSDITFLAEQNIMDYSILVGVKHLSGDEAPVAGLCNHVPSKDLGDVYFVGIIDMLQQYSWRWAVQRWVLGTLLCKDTQDVSAVPARKYGARLLGFIRFSMFNQTRRSSRTSLPGNFSLTAERPSGLGQLTPRILVDADTAMLDVTPSMLWLSANLHDPAPELYDII